MIVCSIQKLLLMVCKVGIVCPPLQFSRQNCLGHAQAHFSVFCKLPLIHRIACPGLGPGKCFSHDPGQFLNPCWTAKIFIISQEFFFSFFGRPVPFLHYSFLCSMHSVLSTLILTFLYLIFSLTFIFLPFFFCLFVFNILFHFMSFLDPPHHFSVPWISADFLPFCSGNGKFSGVLLQTQPAACDTD